MEEVSHNSYRVLDSGASRHMIGEKSLYNSMQPLEEPIIVTIGKNARCLAKGKGMISFVTTNGESRKISDVLYVPKIKRNLLSIASIRD